MTTLGPGATVDRYRLVAPAGEGGQGSVWRAEDPLREGAPVALKLVPVGSSPAGSIERFRREARSLARLAHPSLPRCHALFEDLRHDVVGIALDFIEGSPLSVRMASESLGRAHRVWIVRHLAAALAYIHDAGVVHRDVKPQNVMICERFTEHPEDPAGVKLVDFGIAAAPHNPSPITVKGGVTGTLDYLAPELLDPSFWKGDRDGPERDVFALGVLAFELLRGQHPAALTLSDVPGAAPGDLMLVYRAHEGKDTWPPGIGARGEDDTSDDPLAPLYRKSLALRVSGRARNGAELVPLLDAVTMGTTPAKPGPMETAPGRAGAQELASAPGPARSSAGGTLVSAAEPASPRARRVPSSDDSGRARLESARTELSASTASPASILARRRSNKVIAAFVVGGASLFSVSFYVSYTRPFPVPTPQLPAELRGLHPDPGAEEPPDPAEPAKPSRPTPPAVRPASTSDGAGALAAPASSSACPAEMVAVAGPPAFCMDKHEVTVADYRRCAACGAAKEAYWVGTTATAAALAEQTANCTVTRTGLDAAPINCVSWQDAATYCAGVQKRIPRLSEWRAARSSISICAERSGVCPMFEWSSDPAPLQGYRVTRGPSFRHPTALEGSNVDVARNDDLGFRCARDPLK